MSCIGILIYDIAMYYNVSRSTVSNVIRRSRSSSTENKEKMGHIVKLNEHRIRLFRKYALENRFEKLYVVLARFKKLPVYH